MDLNTLWDKVASVFMEIVLSLYNIIEKIFQIQMLQSILNIFKGIGMIMVAVVEAILRVLKMLIH